jgi:hypothetical protein
MGFHRGTDAFIIELFTYSKNISVDAPRRRFSVVDESIIWRHGDRLTRETGLGGTGTLLGLLTAATW